MTDYAAENIGTEELRGIVQNAADADIVGAGDLLGAMEE